MKHSQQSAPAPRHSVSRSIVTIIAEVLLTFAAICIYYFFKSTYILNFIYK